MIVTFAHSPQSRKLWEMAGVEYVPGRMELSFFLNCVPTAQMRARHTNRGWAYKAAPQKANERTLEALLATHVPEKPICGAIALSFTAFFAPPKSVSKKTRAKMLAMEIRHTSKPDLDNLAKQLKDAMTRMRFWQDDRQVCDLRCQKLYSETPGWRVGVKSICGIW